MAQDRNNILPFLPEEIIVNILQKLHVGDALLRFRCVSKQWYRLISETKTWPKKHLLKSVSKETKVSFRSIDQATSKIENLDIPWKSRHTWIYGSCDGLVLVGLMDDLFLWNPFTGYRQKIFSYEGLSKSENRRIGGLCFDSIDNDYKVVLSPNHEVVGPGCAMVGSCKHKSWKRIDFPYREGLPLRSGPLLNNHIHWSASKDSELQYFYSTGIIYFDAEIDKFIDLPMPPSPVDGGDAIVGLGVLDGCLCMSRSKGHYQCELQILAMKVYGVGESWMTLFKIEGPLFSNTFVPLFYSDEKKNEVVMNLVEVTSQSIITYDIGANSKKNISTSLYSECEMVYEESLIRLSGYELS